MTESLSIDVGALRIGMHVQLELGWMRHPFPLSSFRLASEDQLQTLRGLGLKQVRVLPARSDAEALQALQSAHPDLILPPAAAPGADAPSDATPAATVATASGALPVTPAAPESAESAEAAEAAARRRRREALQAEQACAAQAERHYAEAGRGLKRSYELALSQPEAARTQCEGQVHGFLDTVLGEGEMAIRLLGEAAGDRAALHAVNVTVVSLLLGQQLGLDKDAMFDLGVGAMLHDVGKLELPDRVRWIDPLSAQLPTHERQFYQQHVAEGVVIGRRMLLAPGALAVLAQHHEYADGSGFPLKLAGEQLGMAARIVALVNRYDNLCNPASPVNALTPHEALAMLYGQMKAKFDAAVFGAFVKMMGVYPPGSVVQLTDARYAMVLSVNAARPLKPRVLVHDPKQPRDDALPLDLETAAGLGIRRSLKPQHLPRATLDYLSPRARVCYFFERARDPAVLHEGQS